MPLGDMDHNAETTTKAAATTATNLRLHVKILPTATQDSEDGAQISGADGTTTNTDDDETDHAITMASGGGGGGGGGRQRGSPSSGHLDPKRRRIYLALLAFSSLNALLGLSLILLWMFQYRPTKGLGLSDKGQLSNLHPVLMYTFMVSLNMYAILVYRTHYDQPKERLKWTHAIMSGANIVMSLLGVAAMYKAHLMANIANFYSLHSWIGATTNALYLAQFLTGFVTFLRPGLDLSTRKRLMPWHRLAGAAILVLASMAAVTGIGELVIFQDKGNAYAGFTAITFIANVAGMATLLMTAATIYLVTSSQYARPPSSQNRAAALGELSSSSK